MFQQCFFLCAPLLFVLSQAQDSVLSSLHQWNGQSLLYRTPFEETSTYVWSSSVPCCVLLLIKTFSLSPSYFSVSAFMIVWRAGTEYPGSKTFNMFLKPWPSTTPMGLISWAIKLTIPSVMSCLHLDDKGILTSSVVWVYRGDAAVVSGGCPCSYKTIYDY